VIETGMGRVRLRRFAAVTIPATVAAVGMGYAVVTGMVSAQLTSANGFELSTNQMSADALKARPGQAPDAAGGGTVYAETTNARANQLHVVTNSVDLPLVGCYGLKIDSTDPNVGLGNVSLNAKTLTTPSGANLADVQLGVDQESAGFDSAAAGYDANGTALTSGTATLPDLSADAYLVKLNGLSLTNLSLGVQKDTTSEGCTA